MTDFLDRLAPLAWTQIWQVTLVAAAIAVLTRLSCRNRPHLAYVLWLIVLIKCLTPPIWSSPTGVFSWAGRERVAIVAADATPKTNGKKAQEITERTEIRGERRSTAAREEKPSSTPTEAQLAMPPSNRSVISPQRMASEGSVAPHGETRPDSAAIVVAEPHGGDSSGSRLVAVLFDIWLGGVIVYSIVILRALLGWRRVFRASVIPEDDRLSSLATDLARRLGIRRRVTVRLTNEPLGPVAVGWFRPAVLLPKALVLTRTLDEIEPLLAHELIHIRRGDALVGLLQIAAGALWWFHPLVWWANRQIARERERSCDEEVVASLGCDPGRYARGLLDVLELKHRLRPLAALPGVRPFDITKQRLEHIMQPARQFQRRPPRRYWIVLLAGFLVLAPAAGVSRTSEPNQTSDTNANVNAVKSVEASAGGQSSSDEQQPRTEGAANNVATATSSQNSRPEPVLQMGHMGQITCVAFSPDGHYVLTGSNDGSAIVWRAETGRQLRTIHTVRGFVQAVEFTTDSKNAIIASSEGVVVIYDLGTGKLIRELIPQDQPLPKGVATNRGPIPTCLATGPDGKQLLIGYQDGTASLWDLGTGEEVRTLQGRGEIDSVAFDPKGKYLATNGWGDDVAVLWDLATGEKVRTFQAEKSLQSAPGTAPSPTSCVAFMPNGTELLAGALDNTVISWDVGSGERLRTFQGNRSLVISLAVNDDGTQVTTRNAAGTVILWDVKSRRKIHTLQAATHAVPSQSSSSVAFSPNGTLVLAVSDDGGAALWDAASGKQFRTFDRSSDAAHVVWAAIAPEGKRLYLGSDRWAISSWDTVTGQRAHDYLEPTSGPDAVFTAPVPTIAALSPDGKRLLTGGSHVAIWDTTTGKKIREFDERIGKGETSPPSLFAAPAPVGPVRGSRQTARDASAPAGGGRRGPAGNVPSHQGSTPTFPQIRVAFSPDGKHVIGWSSGAMIEWEAESGAVMESYVVRQQGPQADATIAAAAIHPNGKQLLVYLAGDSRPQRVVYDEARSPHVTVWQGLPFRSLQFNPDGTEVVGVLDDRPVAFSMRFPDGTGIHMFNNEGEVEFQDLQFAVRRASGPVDSLYISAIGLSADTNRLFIPSYSDHAAVIWDVPTGKAVRTVHGEQRCLGFAVFTADRKHVLTGGLQPTAVLWNTETGTQEAVLVMWNGGKDWLVSASNGLFDGSPGGREKLAFRVGGGLEVVPSKDLEKDLYRPGLLAALLRGEVPSRAAVGK